MLPRLPNCRVHRCGHWAWYRYRMSSSIWWRTFGSELNCSMKCEEKNKNCSQGGDWNQIVGVTGTFFWIKRVWFACLLPHLLLLLTSQIHFSHSSLSSSTPFQRQFHEYHAASFFIPISSFPPLLEGSIYTCSSSSKSSSLFYLQSSESQQVSNLLISLSIPYKIFLSDYSKQSRIHSQLQLTYPIFIQRTIIFS